jgi:hypothetical protein
MSEDNTLTEDEAPDHIKQLRADAEKGRKLESMLADKEREIAFLQAGIKTDTKLGAMLMKTYEGELSPEAIKAEAAELGLVEKQEEPETVEPDSPEAQMMQARENLSTGRTATTEIPETNAVDAAFGEWNDSRKEGMSSGEAQDMAFASFIAAAARGDSSAQFDEGAWRQKSAMYGHGA